MCTLFSGNSYRNQKESMLACAYSNLKGHLREIFGIWFFSVLHKKVHNASSLLLLIHVKMKVNPCI